MDEAEGSSFDVCEGDIIVMGTDGLFDNLSTSQILQEVEVLKVWHNTSFKKMWILNGIILLVHICMKNYKPPNTTIMKPSSDWSGYSAWVLVRFCRIFRTPDQIWLVIKKWLCMYSSLVVSDWSKSDYCSHFKLWLTFFRLQLFHCKRAEKSNLFFYALCVAECTVSLQNIH